MDNNKELMSEERQGMQMAGGWSEYFTDISAENMEVFNKAIEGFLGVKYSPIAVSTQVVAGMNYSFLCNSKVVAPGSPNELANVEIFRDLQGNCIIKSINMIRNNMDSMPENMNMIHH